MVKIFLTIWFVDSESSDLFDLDSAQCLTGTPSHSWRKSLK